MMFYDEWDEDTILGAVALGVVVCGVIACPLCIFCRDLCRVRRRYMPLTSLNVNSNEQTESLLRAGPVIGDPVVITIIPANHPAQ